MKRQVEADALTLCPSSPAAPVGPSGPGSPWKTPQGDPPEPVWDVALTSRRSRDVHLLNQDHSPCGPSHQAVQGVRQSLCHPAQGHIKVTTSHPVPDGGGCVEIPVVMLTLPWIPAPRAFHVLRRLQVGPETTERVKKEEQAGVTNPGACWLTLVDLDERDISCYCPAPPPVLTEALQQVSPLCWLTTGS